MKYEREYLVGVVENVFKDIDIVWSDNGITEKVKNIDIFKKEENINEQM